MMGNAPSDPYRREPHAGDLFTDREADSEAFAASLVAHRAAIDRAMVPVERRNVVSFCGVGGVGKTALSERLEAWVCNELPLFDEWGSRPGIQVAATVRINFEGSRGNFDVEAAIIAIRQRLARIQRVWPAFDFAFAAYWSAAHPGRPLPGSGTEAREWFGGAVGEAIQALASDLGALDVVSAAGLHTVHVLARELRKGKVKRRAFASFDNYADLVERVSSEPTPDDPRPDLLIDLVQLLDNDLRTWADGPAPLVVVFIDTIERLWLDPRRVGEAALNRIVYEMPHVLFVMTGRNMLDWYSPRRATLHRAGPAMWPGLVPGALEDPRQHVVGNLSPNDTRELILRGRTAFDLPIPDEVVDRLVEASGGFPQYLDLARIVAAIVKDNGAGPVTVADVTGSLGDLVMRVLDDIPEDEQRALRAATFFAYFDTQLVAATAGVTHGCAERAAQRPMIDQRTDDRYPYRMHEEIRAFIRAVGPEIPGGWAPADWQDAAERALHEARRRHSDAVCRNDSLGVLLALGLAVGIVCEFDVAVEPDPAGEYDDWLTGAILYGPSAAGLRPYVPAAASTTYGKAIIDFILAKTSELPPTRRQALLRAVFDSTHPLSQPAGRHLAYGLRSVARWDDALGVLDDLIERSPRRDLDLHLHQKAVTLAVARRFRDALAAVAEVEDSRRDRLVASVRRTHGHPEPWLSLRPDREEILRSASRRREYLEARGDTIFDGLLLGRVPTDGEVGELLAEAELVGHGVSVRACLATNALMRPGSQSEDLLERLEALEAVASGRGLGWRSALVRATWAYISGDTEAAGSVTRSIDNLSSARGRAWVPVECLLDHMGHPPREQPTQWLEPYEDIRERWVGHFEAHRTRVT